MKCPVCDAERKVGDSGRCTFCGCPEDPLPSEISRLRASLKEKVGRGGSLSCLRCGSKLKYYGVRHFHEGKGHPSFWLGDWGELAVNRVVLDAYACQVCGKVEFFVDGIGERLRNEKSANQ